MPEYDEMRLDAIAGEIQYWLDFQESDHEKIDDDLHVMSPPSWPTRGVLKLWIKVLKGEKI